MRPRLPKLLCTLVLALSAAAVQAAASDPAVAQVQTLTAALLKSMQAGSSVSTPERYRRLEPVIQQVFALPLMTRIAVGPDWASFSPEQQKASIAAFSRFTVANYAYNFRDFDGQKFEVEEQAASRGADKLVQSRIISAHGTSTSLLYRMRDVDGAWKVLDVYSEGVSELTLRRSDFVAAIAAGGAPALIVHLNKASDGLMNR